MNAAMPLPNPISRRSLDELRFDLLPPEHLRIRVPGVNTGTGFSLADLFSAQRWQRDIECGIAEGNC